MSGKGIDVVTVFVRMNSQVLLMKRSDKVRTFQGHWSAVSGYIEAQDKTPLDRAIIEVQEELGVSRDSYELSMIGRPFLVDNTWRVHPFRFDLRTPVNIQLNWENTTHEWVAEEVVGNDERKCVPGLKIAWDKVHFDHEFEQILLKLKDNRSSGATDLSEDCMNYLEQTTCEESLLNDKAYAMAKIRPSMKAIKNSIVDWIRTGKRTEYNTVEEVLKVGKDWRKVMTNSNSNIVAEALGAMSWLEEVWVLESRPLCEGVDLALKLLDSCKVVLVTDAQMGVWIRDMDAVVFGADAVFDSGVVNKAGTYPLSLCANHNKIPVYALCNSSKVSAGEPERPGEEMSPDEIVDMYERINSATALFPRTQIRNAYFDVTPLQLIDSVVTEAGPLSHKQVQALVEIRESNQMIWMD